LILDHLPVSAYGLPASSNCDHRRSIGDPKDTQSSEYKK
jgi:hypothetical protein